MIRLSCKKCGHKLKLGRSYLGKKVECPECESINLVHKKSEQPRPERIKFDCEHCGGKIRVSPAHAGKKGRCPRCKNPIVVPTIVGVACSICSVVTQVVVTSQERIIECPACGHFMEVPGKDGPSPSPEPEDTRPDPEASAESKRPKRIRIIIASVVALLAVVLLVFALCQKGQTRTILLLTTLSMVNIPTYVLIWKVAFAWRWDFQDCLSAGSDLMLTDFRVDDFLPGNYIVLVVFIFLCMAVVYGEYSLLNWLAHA